MKIYTPRKQATLPIPKTNCPNCGGQSNGTGKKTIKKTKK